MRNVKKYLYTLLLMLAMLLCTAMLGTNMTALAESEVWNVTLDFNTEELSENLALKDRTLDNIVCRVSDGYSISRENIEGISGIRVFSEQSSQDKATFATLISQFYTIEWREAGAKVSIDSPIYRNHTYVAHWTPISYKITYNYGVSDVLNEINGAIEYHTYDVTSDQINFHKPTRPNYNFDGWYRVLDSKGNYFLPALNNPVCSVGSYILYAKWTPKDYVINYHVGDATNANPIAYTIDGGEITLVSPKREGYEFLGWYSDKELTNKVTTITCSEHSGDIDLYPSWEAKSFRVTYILPDGTRESVMCKYGQTASLPTLDNSIFEIVRTSSPRENITEDLRIYVEYVNIWYVYLIALVTIIAITAIVIVAILRKRKAVVSLRKNYQSNSSKYSKAYRRLK